MSGAQSNEKCVFITARELNTFVWIQTHYFLFTLTTHRPFNIPEMYSREFGTWSHGQCRTFLLNIMLQSMQCIVNDVGLINQNFLTCLSIIFTLVLQQCADDLYQKVVRLDY